MLRVRENKRPLKVTSCSASPFSSGESQCLNQQGHDLGGSALKCCTITKCLIYLRGEGKCCMLIQLQQVPLIPHEFLKLSHKSVQPRSLNLVLLQILLPQWTVSEVVILKCKRKRKSRRDPPPKAGGGELTTPVLEILNI